MKSREELLRELAADPGGVADYALQLQAQLREQADQHQQELRQQEHELRRHQQLLAEARAYREKGEIDIMTMGGVAMMYR